jgi:hypothetical protein
MSTSNMVVAVHHICMCGSLVYPVIPDSVLPLFCKLLAPNHEREEHERIHTRVRWYLMPTLFPLVTSYGTGLA